MAEWCKRFFSAVFTCLFCLYTYGNNDIINVTLIGGTGPVGAAFLNYFSSNSDLKINVIGRKDSEHLRAIQNNNGLKIKEDLTQTLLEFSPFDSCDHIANQSQDFILVTMKHPCFSVEMASHINRIVKDNALVAFVFNGLPFYFFQSNKKERGIIKLLKNLKLFHFNCFIAGEKEESGCIKFNTKLKDFKVQFSGIRNVDTEDCHRMEAFLKHQNILQEYVPNYKKLVLEKLKYSLSISSLSALEDKTLDEVCEAGEYVLYIEKCVQVINKIGDRMGMVLDSYETFLKHPSIRQHHSSLWHDIKNGRPNEINEIIGKLVILVMSMNSESGFYISVKLIATLYDGLKKKEMDNLDVLPRSNSSFHLGDSSTTTPITTPLLRASNPWVSRT